MQRVTISLDGELLAEIDRFVEQRGYSGRSEAVRDLLRSGLQQLGTEADGSRECVAALVYAYGHQARELAGRLTSRFHEHHDLALATLHAHLGHDSCLEVALLRGPADAVGDFGERLMAERGVLYGRLVMLPAELSTESHVHGSGPSRQHEHTHIGRSRKAAGRKKKKH